MRPELFRLPLVDWPIRGYGFMIVLGFLASIWLASREVRRRRLPDIVYDLGVAMLVTGLIGGRVFYYIQFYRDDFADQPWYEFFAIWKGGLVFYGGAIGGAIGGLSFLLWKKAPVGAILDAVSPFIPIAMAFGRLGCLMNGCCFGGRCSPAFPLGLTFPGSPTSTNPGAFQVQLEDGLIAETARHALPVYPVQLFEAGYDLLICGLLWWYSRGPTPRGGVFPLLFVLYGLGRFHLEFLRGDNASVLGTLTISQVVSLLLVALFAPVFLYIFVRGRHAGPPTRSAATDLS